jgi:hypothetical protein
MFDVCGLINYLCDFVRLKPFFFLLELLDTLLVLGIDIFEEGIVILLGFSV